MKRVIRFTASWCTPCKMLEKMLKDIDTNVNIEVYDIDKNSDYAIDFGIRSVPTLIMMDGNIEMKRMTGLKTQKDLEEWLNG